MEYKLLMFCSEMLILKKTQWNVLSLIFEGKGNGKVFVSAFLIFLITTVLDTDGYGVFLVGRLREKKKKDALEY